MALLGGVGRGCRRFRGDLRLGPGSEPGEDTYESTDQAAHRDLHSSPYEHAEATDRDLHAAAY